MYFLGGVSKKVIPYIYVPSFIKGAVCVQHCVYIWAVGIVQLAECLTGI